MEDNFEKRIRDTMSNPPDTPFDEGMWKDMDEKLDGINKSSNTNSTQNGWLPLLLLLMLVPGFLAGYFYKRLFRYYK